MPQGHTVTPAQALTSLGLAALLSGGVAATYTIVAWRLGRRRGRKGLVAGWLGAAGLVTALAVSSALRNLTSIRPVDSRDVLLFGVLYLLVFTVGLGAVTRFVGKRLALTSATSPGLGIVVGGVLSFFAALLLLALPVLIWDASRLF